VRFPRHGRANEWLQFHGRILDRVSRSGFDVQLQLKMGVFCLREIAKNARKQRLFPLIHLLCHALKTPGSGAEPQHLLHFSPTNSAEDPKIGFFRDLRIAGDNRKRDQVRVPLLGFRTPQERQQRRGARTSLPPVTLMPCRGIAVRIEATQVGVDSCGVD
jgi:hypothetical protein